VVLYSEKCEESSAQCKGIVNDNLIISKTDLDGVITYANENFCKLSGYEASELIGKPHSVIRSPNGQSEVFERMWETILSKKTWQGRIENRKKNGDFYTVVSIVAPIFDNKGGIAEFVAIRYDVTEQVETEKRLQEAKQKKEKMQLENEMLEEVNRAKESFLLVFTHELKTPLNAVISFSDYISNELKQKGSEFEELSELAHTIRQSGMWMLENVESILDIGRLQADRLSFKYQDLDMMILLSALVKDDKSLIDERSLDVKIDCPAQMKISSDPIQFKRVVANLVSNAIKHAHTKIEISCLVEDGRFRLQVEDDGDGVPQQSREKIFELFEQVEESHLTRRGKGTGIGLFFVKLLCEKMHYSVTCKHSQKLGGASFEVSGEIFPSQEIKSDLSEKGEK